MTVFGKLMQCH